MSGDWTARLARLDEASAAAAAALEAVCFPSGWDADTYARALVAGTCRGWVCTAPDGGLAGYIAVSDVLDEMEVLNVAVRPDLRGQGVGRALLGAALQEARERNMTTCLLEVREGNAAARVLYAHAGFTARGLRRRYYSDGENALVMALDLTAPAARPAAAHEEETP